MDYYRKTYTHLSRSIWIPTRKKRIFVHYLPIIAILSYCLIYYSLVTFGPFCENSFDVFMTGGLFILCLYSTTLLGTWYLLAHQMIPTLIMVISSIALLGRVVRQKRTLNRPIRWRKYRKWRFSCCLFQLFTRFLIHHGHFWFLCFAMVYSKIPHNYS